MTASYAISGWLFTRALSAIYLIAFLSLAVQATGLWGEEGITPAKSYLRAVDQQIGGEGLWRLPSVFWLNASDGALLGAAVLGALAAGLAFAGIAQGWMLLLCWLLYLSFVSVGQEFLSFQWDLLLLEAGFLTLFAVPWFTLFSWGMAEEVSPFIRYAFYLLVFKLMFLAGVVKLASGDSSWRDLSAMTYHFWTQPLPNPLSPFIHALPTWMLKGSTVATFVIELIFPFLVFWPRFRWLAAVGFILLSLLIFTTGNYTFFNLLTIALTLWLVPDSVWSLHFLKVTPASSAPMAVQAVMVVLMIFSGLWSVRYFVPEALSPALDSILRWGLTCNVNNSYGLFAVMTKSRPEIVIEGSLDGKEWREYEFKYKAGDVRRRPPVVEPYQPRLDWQMWFAALGSFRQNPWLQNLMVRILQGSKPVIDLLDKNPFPDGPPKYLRARVYEYEFAAPGEIWSDGIWWMRELKGDYSPVFERP